MCDCFLSRDAWAALLGTIRRESQAAFDRAVGTARYFLAETLDVLTDGPECCADSVHVGAVDADTLRRVAVTVAHYFGMKKAAQIEEAAERHGQPLAYCCCWPLTIADRALEPEPWPDPHPVRYHMLHISCRGYVLPLEEARIRAKEDLEFEGWAAEVAARMKGAPA